MSDSRNECELMDHLEALLVDPDREWLTIRADPESGGLHLRWRSRGVEEVRTIKRIEPNPRLMGVNALRLMREAAGR